MWRGTTPVNTFELPADISFDDFDVVFLTYSQFGKVILDLGLDRLRIDGRVLSLTLTQEETLAFSPGAVQIQMRGRMKDGRAVASNLIITTAKEVLKDGTI